MSIRNGAPAIQACIAAGISDQTLANWRLRGEGGEEPFLGFLVALKKAEAEIEAEMAAVVVDQGRKGQWLASMTYLERRFPKRWGRQERIEIEETGRVVLSEIAKAIRPQIETVNPDGTPVDSIAPDTSPPPPDAP